MTKTTTTPRRRLSTAVQTPLETYLREINETALLTAQDEKDLSRRISAGTSLRGLSSVTKTASAKRASAF